MVDPALAGDVDVMSDFKDHTVASVRTFLFHSSKQKGNSKEA